MTVSKARLELTLLACRRQKNGRRDVEPLLELLEVRQEFPREPVRHVKVGGLTLRLSRVRLP